MAKIVTEQEVLRKFQIENAKGKQSFAEIVASMSEIERRIFFEATGLDSPEAFTSLEFDSSFWLRPKQKVPTTGDWFITALVAGRGFGKTLTMTEWVRNFVKENPGCRLAIAGRTAGDIRNTMVTGEALALNTKVPTPNGWTTMGDLKVGDTIYSGDGKPCMVTKAYPVLYGRDCYTVNISGTEVIADANHKWLTWDFKSRVSLSEGRLRTKFKKSVITTEEIKNTLKFRGQNNHGILSTKIEGTPTELPIDPYLLGYWLGDGTSKSSEITVHDDDKKNLWDSVWRAGYVPTHRKTKYVVGITKGFQRDLKSNGLHRNKHIPDIYLRTTYEDRLQLVRGLMDSDGCVDSRNGALEFSNKNPRIIRGMYELLTSLGIRVRECRPNGAGQMRLSFTTSIPVFQLKRKLDRVREYRREDDWRYISSVEPTGSTPVRCIEVDSDDHTFLITDSFIRTHNSGLLKKSPENEKPEYKKMESMLVWPMFKDSSGNPSTAQLLSSEVPDAARGPQYHATLADEFAAWKTTPDASGATLFDNLVLATRLGKSPKMLLATTPKRTKVMKEVMAWSKDPTRKVNIVTGSTYENATLSPDYLRNIENQYGDSDLAKQELEGLMLEDAEGIVFTDSMLDNASSVDSVPSNLIKIVAVDPTVAGDPKNADECGIMVIGATRESDYRHRTAYVLEDATVTAKPEDWAKVVADTARKWGIRNVVVETNQGGDLLRNIIQSTDNGLIVHNVTATKGKVKRVEPVAIKMQQGKVFFSPKDDFLQLKDQLTFYDPDISGYSPDRMDAFAWGVTALLIDPPKTLRFGTFQAHRAKGSMPRRMNTGRSVRKYGNRSPRR